MTTETSSTTTSSSSSSSMQDQSSEDNEDAVKVVEKVYVVSDTLIKSMGKIKEKGRRTASSLFSDDRFFGFCLLCLLSTLLWAYVFYAVSEEFLEIERYRALTSVSSGSGSSVPGDQNPSPSPGYMTYRPSPLHSPHYRHQDPRQ